MRNTMGAVLGELPAGAAAASSLEDALVAAIDADREIDPDVWERALVGIARELLRRPGRFAPVVAAAYSTLGHREDAQDVAQETYLTLMGAVSRDPDDAQRMMRLHVDGTRKVMERMAAHDIRRQDGDAVCHSFLGDDLLCNWCHLR